ncbi:MAG: toll/interleukin-1 receptor domain-containing protein [Terriglobales bacterium]|jgi:hypothetical protein
MKPNGRCGKGRATSTPSRNGRSARGQGNDFDVFICYNSADRSIIRRIAGKLQRLGVRAWLDEWEVPPFVRWQDELQKVIPQLRAAAVFVGPSGVGPWEDIEVHALLQEFARRRIRMGVVLLPGSPADPEVPLFMKMFHWVDFRKADPDPINQLVWGITGKRPAHR